MINNKYLLTSPYTFQIKKEEIQLDNNQLVVQPTLLSICAADLRYYQGKRDEKILEEKLPMVLVHEAIGKVVFDPQGIFHKGQNVVMVPNQPVKEIDELDFKENYDRSSKFRSSSMDGFLQEYLTIDADRVLDITGIDEFSATMIELLSVVFNALDDCKFDIKENHVVGVWGNGNLGFLMILILRYLYPNITIYLYGRNDDKNLIFTGQDKVFNVKESDLFKFPVDIAFECVGGVGSEAAINQAIEIINPQGYIGLLGVSEMAPKINTRMVLEKGITLQGSSRSSVRDFQKAIKFLKESENNQNNVKRLITEIVEVNSLSELQRSFDKSIVNNFKTVIKFNI